MGGERESEATLRREGRTWFVGAEGREKAYAWRGAAMAAYAAARTQAGTKEDRRLGVRSEIAAAGGWGGLSRAGEVHDAVEEAIAGGGADVVGTLTDAHFLDPDTGVEFAHLSIRAGGVASLEIPGETTESVPTRDFPLLVERMRSLMDERRSHEESVKAAEAAEKAKKKREEEEEAAEKDRRSRAEPEEKRGVDLALESFLRLEDSARGGDAKAAEGLTAAAPMLASALEGGDISPTASVRGMISYWADRAAGISSRRGRGDDALGPDFDL